MHSDKMSSSIHDDQKYTTRKTGISLGSSPQNIPTVLKWGNCFWRSKHFSGSGATSANGLQKGYQIEVHSGNSEVLETVIHTGSLAAAKKKLNESEKVVYPAKLTTEDFAWGETCLKLNDVLAVSYNEGTCWFIVHSFPITKSTWTCKRTSRKLKETHLLAPTVEEALKWAYAFESRKCFVNRLQHLSTTSKRQSSRIDAHDSPPKCYAGRVMLVIINPHSGHGRALKIYNSKVEPILKLAGIKLNVIETTGPHHAHKLAATVDISTCINGIICVGGDGIVNEVVNGLLSRDSVKQLVEIPIGIIPAGSDNSLIWSVMGIHDPSSAALAIVKGDLMPTDVFAVEWMKTGDVHMGLTVAYHGFMSDVLDLSQKYQKRFGPLKYLFAGAQKFLCLPAYECEVEYLPVNSKIQQDGAEKDASYRIKSLHNFTDPPRKDNVGMDMGFKASNDTHSNEPISVVSRKSVDEYGVLSEMVDANNETSEYVRGLDAKSKRMPSIRGAAPPFETEDIVTISNSVATARTPSPRPRTRSKPKMDRGWSAKGPGTGNLWDYSVVGEHAGEVTLVSEGMSRPQESKWTDRCHNDLECGLLPEPESSEWVLKQGPFLAVLVCNHKCRTVQCLKSQLLALNAEHDDGNLDLLLVHKVGRLQLLRFLILMQFGRHLSLPFVEYMKVKAVKIKPEKSKHKSCGIDGELMKLDGPISITVLGERCQLIGHPVNSKDSLEFY